MRPLFAYAIVAASLIATRTAAAPGTGELGAPCSIDADCGDAALICFRADAALGVPGPAGGLCTAPCDRTADCRSLIGGNAVCGPLHHCLEECMPDIWFGSELDPGKCHGREDVACGAVSSGTGDVAGLCAPLCASDDQCGASLFCNRVNGLCDPVPPAGDPPGTACDRFAQNTCAGFCVGTCVEPCVIGAHSGCSATTAERPLGAACLLAVGGSSVGDLGGCVALCTCSSDCAEAELCAPSDFEGRFDAAGKCVAGPRPEGAPDCLEQDEAAGTADACAFGPLHPCKTDDCLGTAECLPNGDYGECQCIAVPDAGRADANHADASAAGPKDGSAREDFGDSDAARDGSAQRPSERDSGGCACSTPRNPTSGVLLALFCFAAIALRTVRSRMRPPAR